MGETTKISWAHATFNPWWGCVRVSPACENCYAETFAKRTGHPVWGVKASRRLFGDKHWAAPLKWDRDAAAAGERRRVFCASMADVFEDRRDLDEPRFRLWKLIEATPNLDWLLLTKRPENHEMVPLAWQTGSRRPHNVWFGTTIEDNRRYRERIGHLLRPAWAEFRFVSMEPLLEETRIERHFLGQDGQPGALISWVITGSESGHGRRPTDEDWVRALRDDCVATGAAFFYKQRVLPNGLKIEVPELDGRRWDQVPEARR